MRFFVVSPDGQKFGPADLKLLNQWVQEGRILPGHELEEETSGRRMRAEQVPGLFPKTTFANPPMSGAYIPPSVATAPIIPTPQSNADASKAWNHGMTGLACVLVGSACCLPFSLAGGVLGCLGVVKAMEARKAGNQSAQGAMVLGIVVVAIAILVLLGHFSLSHFVPRF